MWKRIVSNEGFRENGCLFYLYSNDLLLHTCRLADANRENGNKAHTLAKHSANNHRGALTSRELEVLALLENGENTNEIAAMMYISKRSVGNHIQHLLHKLHVHNRL